MPTRRQMSRLDHSDDSYGSLENRIKNRKRIRTATTWLSMISLWPYIIATVGIFLDQPKPFIEKQSLYCLFFIVAWSASINCFVAGMHWSAMSYHNQRRFVFTFLSVVFCVVASLSAVFATLLSVDLLSLSLGLLIIVVCLQFMMDYYFYKIHVLSDWYWLIRKVAGFCILICLVISCLSISEQIMMQLDGFL